MEGTDEEPLKKEEDGIIEAIVNMSRSNGTMIARVQEKENGKPIKIDTKDYPMRIEIKDTEKIILIRYTQNYVVYLGIINN